MATFDDMGISAKNRLILLKKIDTDIFEACVNKLAKELNKYSLTNKSTLNGHGIKHLKMRKIKSIKVPMLLVVILFSLKTYSQYGIIEMKNGEQFEMAISLLHVEGDKLRYFKEEWKQKHPFLGIGMKKNKQEYLDKSAVVNISDIKKIHAEGEFYIRNTLIDSYIGIKFIKQKKRYEQFYVIIDRECQLLLKLGGSNVLFYYYVQTGDEDPFLLREAGPVFGAKYEPRAKKYFANCEPAMAYIKNGLKRSSLPKLIEIYNDNCL